MSALRVITILELNNIMIAPFTNNLAAYGSLLKRIPKELQVKIMSYSTVNRAVQKAGEHIDIPTPLGIYVIKKTLLFKKAV